MRAGDSSPRLCCSRGFLAHGRRIGRHGRSRSTPLAAGGAADVIGHAVADAFTAATKLPVIIDNRPGGGGTLAAVTVARAEPDGTTLLLGTAAALNVAPVLAKNFPADLVGGLTPLTLAVELP